MYALTLKERAICVAVCEGKNGEQVAGQFGWKSPQIVKNYLTVIYRKTGACDRLSLALMLFRHGVVECPCDSVNRVETALDLIRSGVIACPCAAERKTA